MDRLKLDQNGGVWIFQDTLDFMQRVDSEAISAIVTLLGNNVIISGCVQNGSSISDGVVIIGGEIMPFVGGSLLDNVIIQESTTKEQFEDGTQKDFYIRRKAVMTLGAGVPFSDFSNVKTLRAFKDLPTTSSDDYSISLDDTLATIKAVYDLKQELKNQVPAGVILMWSGAIANIPSGFALCDGLEGRPYLMDQFIVAAGNNYAVGQTGGSNTKTINQNNLPSAMTFGVPTMNEQDTGGIASGRTSQPEGTFNVTFQNPGGGQPLDIRPVYYALAFIIKL